jgi:hypothetical protein
MRRHHDIRAAATNARTIAPQVTILPSTYKRNDSAMKTIFSPLHAVITKRSHSSGGT